MYDELVKALRYCVNDDIRECDECPYNRKYRCRDLQANDAADAIERLVDEVDRKDKAIQGLLDAVDKKSVKIDLWKRAWKMAYKLYTESKALKGEQDGEQGTEQKQ